MCTDKWTHIVQGADGDRCGGVLLDVLLDFLRERTCSLAVRTVVSWQPQLLTPLGHPPLLS